MKPAPRPTLFLNPSQIRHTNQRLAESISYKLDAMQVPSDTIIDIVGVMDGAIHFASDLSRLLFRETRLHLVSPSLITNPYRSPHSSQGLFKDHMVIIVDTIVETGKTLKLFEDTILSPAGHVQGLISCALITRTTTEHFPTFYGVRAKPEDGFFWGYGLDDRTHSNRNYPSVFSEGYTSGSNLFAPASFRTRDFKLGEPNESDEVWIPRY